MMRDLIATRSIQLDRCSRVWGGAEAHRKFRMRRTTNEVRTRLALGKDEPAGRAVQRSGAIVAIPILSGLHHHYLRI
jgi:hypothetical protein